MAFTVGDLIDGHYRVERRFAGGMGFVYIVLDEIVGKRFAIKQLPSFQAENKIRQERFRREAAAWLLLEYHANIVQAHSFHPRPEGPMLILEYVDGPSFDQLLKSEGRISPVQLVTYARQLCQAMNYAHTRAIPERGVGVLHRDIKPGNILVTSTNQLKITDFGLAKMGGESRITGEGQFVGTIAYSSPEQLRSSSEVTKASDVYSFGAVMYQALAGRAPFLSRSPADLFKMIIDTPALPLEELCPDGDRQLCAVVMRCIEKDPAERYADFVQLEKAIAGMEMTLRDRRDWSCKKCGFVSRNNVQVCSVCETVRDEAVAVPSAIPDGWTCPCGARVGAEHKNCPACGRSRAGQSLAAVLADEDAPLPVIADLIPFETGSDSGSAAVSTAKPQGPGETLWPVRQPAPPASASPGDSHIGSAAASERQPEAASRQLWDPTSNSPKLVELGSRDRLMAWPLERASYTVGRDAKMRIRVKDPTVAPYQLFLARLPVGWLAMNRQLESPVEFNGWRMVQRLLEPRDVLHFGATWLICDGCVSREKLVPIPGSWQRQAGDKIQSNSTGGSSVTEAPTGEPVVCVLDFPDGSQSRTTGRSMVIGTTRLCDVRLDDPSVAPVHALIAFQNDGVNVFDLTGTELKMVDGRTGARHRLRNRDGVRIGDVTVRIRIEGDASAPARVRMVRDAAQPNRLAVSIVSGPQRGQCALLPTGRPVALGRHSECDLVIAADQYMSRKHLQLVSNQGAVEIKDLGSRHGFSVGATSSTTTAVARIGDVIKVGQTFLLVHGELPAI